MTPFPTGIVRQPVDKAAPGRSMTKRCGSGKYMARGSTGPSVMTTSSCRPSTVRRRTSRSATPSRTANPSSAGGGSGGGSGAGCGGYGAGEGVGDGDGDGDGDDGGAGDGAGDGGGEGQGEGAGCTVAGGTGYGRLTRPPAASPPRALTPCPSSAWVPSALTAEPLRRFSV